MLRLPQHWVWDSWLADDGERYHLYFLKAPRTPDNPMLRHTGAVIGHASSADLLDWQLHEDALRPSEHGWDDLATWTGSIVPAPSGGWVMFYTALSRRGLGILDQRIGLARSDDLHDWHRISQQPALRADPRWYKTLDRSVDRTGEASETWRDPFVFADPDGEGWHMLITARTTAAGRNDDGVVGHARSADLRHWQVGPPLSEPAGFGQLEVLQLRVIDGRPLLIFTCHPAEQTAERIAQYGHFSTWTVVADSLTGPWDLSTAKPFTAEPWLFAAPLVQLRDGGWALIGFRNLQPEGSSFEIIDPIRVQLRDGALVAAGGTR